MKHSPSPKQFRKEFKPPFGHGTDKKERRKTIGVPEISPRMEIEKGALKMGATIPQQPSEVY